MKISLNQVPLKGLEKVVDPHVMGFGTNLDEQIFNLKEYHQMIKNQEDQGKSVKIKFKNSIK